jgi:pyridoxamine 5'-phosphate oxidase
MSFADLRREYARATLDEASVAHDPFQQFDTWFSQAVQAGVPLANTMALATADARGQPSVRAVLLKGVDPRGFVFYTNYRSRKAAELLANPAASALFWWEPLERQVRIDGAVEQVRASESDAYFQSRPLGSRLAACASPQSTVVRGREELESLYENAARQYGNEPPRPAEWGGFRLIPHAFEFWQGRENRLHDRLVYRPAPSGWVISRLAP